MSGDPAALFGALMSDADPAMVVVTAVEGDERAGCLVGFHSQCSIDPVRYAVWLSKANHTYRVALLAEHVAVHFLDAGDDDVAALFGGTSGDDVDKFARSAWTPGPGSVPLLDRCPNRVVGRRHTLVDEGGDHVCLVLTVDDVTRGGPFTPLRLSDVTDLEPGHGNQERPHPDELRQGPTGR